jgi:hypothetical protein
MKENKGILGGKRFKFVRSSLEFVASFIGKVLSDLFSETNIGVKASSNSGTALSNLKDILESHFNTSKTMLKLCNITTKLLTKSKWCGILSVGTANLDNILELISFLLK